MPPRGVKSRKRKRQYKHIKASGKKRGMSNERAEQMAARTVNKQRRKSGETRGSRKRSSSRKSSSRRRSSSRSSGSRKSSSGRRRSRGSKKK
jgi:hypothetical protein